MAEYYAARPQYQPVFATLRIHELQDSLPDSLYRKNLRPREACGVRRLAGAFIPAKAGASSRTPHASRPSNISGSQTVYDSHFQDSQDQNDCMNIETRSEYKRGELDRSELKPSPFEQFAVWFAKAIEAKVIEPNAMSLATA